MEALNNYFFGTNSNDEILFGQLDKNTNGIGKLFVHNNEMSYSYNGAIINGKMTGNGLIIYIMNKDNPTYKSYQGYLTDNLFETTGQITYTNGDIFIGSFLNGKKNGHGQLYNSNGDLIMDNIWKDDIVCGKIKYNLTYHGTNNKKVEGELYNSIKIGTWIYYRENQTIDNIQYYSDIDIELDKINENLLNEITTHQTGYIVRQLIDNYSDQELMMGKFSFYSEKLKNNNVDFMNLPNIAVPVKNELIKDHTYILYLNQNGEKTHISEYLNGIEYTKIIYLNENNEHKCILNNLYTDSMNVIIIPAIYEINKNNMIPMLYYEGELNNSNQPSGKGKMYSKSLIKFYGNFEKGTITHGSMYEFNSNGISYLAYEGTFKNNIPNGEGVFYNQNALKIYEGQILDGKRDGNGISYWENPENMKNWDGQWKKDKKHGNGNLYDTTDVLICRCVHEYDEIVSIV
jgi:hypothetical protein